MPWRESAEQLARARAERPTLVPSPQGMMFGIFTPPAPDAPPAGLCAVLLTRPRSHRNRMWVEGARYLAARGFACFRLDYHGSGDSEGQSAFLNPNTPYRDDVVAAIRHLRAELGQTRFVISGACFDARTALSAFMDESDAIDGLVFMAAPVMELDTMVRMHADHTGWRHLFRALGNPGNWRALGQAERWRYMATVVGRVAQRSVAASAAEELPLSRSFIEHFGALVRSRARALFLYGLEDDECASFQVAQRKLFAALDPATRARFDVEVWPGTVHGFLEMERQRETFARALAWIEARHPAAEPALASNSSTTPANWS